VCASIVCFLKLETACFGIIFLVFCVLSLGCYGLRVEDTAARNMV